MSRHAPSKDVDIVEPICVDAKEETEFDRGRAVLSHLQKNHRSSKLGRACDELGAALKVSSGTAERYLQAMAEACCRGDSCILEDVCRYLAARKVSLKALCYIHYQTYDETPLRCRLLMQAGDNHSVSQIAKVYVVSTSWVLGVKPVDAGPGDHPMLLHGHWAPAMRAADSGTGKGIAAILDTCPQPPSMIDEICDIKVRLTDTDENGSNVKAERLWSLAKHGPGWVSSQYMCLGHKLHSVAEKTWAKNATVLSGAMHALLAIQTTPQLSELISSMNTLIEQHGQRLPASSMLSESATQFRKQILTAFLPRKKHARKRATAILLAQVFNADWRRDGQYTHICGEGCCGSREESIVMRLLLTEAFSGGGKKRLFF